MPRSLHAGTNFYNINDELVMLVSCAVHNPALAGTLQTEIELYDAGTPVRDVKP
jgi:hypothetical protein